MSDRNPGLDGIRGLAVLFVLLFHTTHMGHESAVSEFLWRITRGMNGGVDVFFVLSGFLITGILYDAKGSTNYFSGFYARRTLRIFPLYYLVVASCFILPKVLPNLTANYLHPLPYGGANYWLYLSNVWKTGSHAVLGVTWSLAVEEQFYLVWPLIVFSLSRESLMRLCPAAWVLALSYRVARVYFHAPVPDTAPVTYIDLLCMGGWIALRLRSSEPLDCSRWAVRCATAGIALEALVVAVEKGFWGRLHETLGITAIGLMSCAAILSVVNSGSPSPVAKAFAWAPFQTLGKYSYAIYLIHSPLDAVLRRTVFRAGERFETLSNHQILAQLLYWGLVGSLSLGLGWVSWNLYEKHFLNLKRLFPVRRKSAPLETATSPVAT
ncbi:MAG TPA: acyltransferase [Planctomycetota bacterium]|nr:acyltransferase [Planctomycetota bacterium]